jgi:hypothetical protein
MGLFGKKVVIPEWATFFSEKEYSVFSKAVDSYLKGKLKLVYEIRDGVVEIQDNQYGLSNLGLMNVAQMCRQGKVEQYSQIVEYHFNLIREANAFKASFQKIEKDFDQVRQYIAVRIYDLDYIEAVGMEHVISRDFAESLHAVLVYDFPSAIENIRPEKSASWNKSLDELFDIGIENVRKNYGFDVKPAELGADKDILYFCETEHFFAPNVLFDIEKHSQIVGKSGSLIAVPTRHLAVIYPINDLNVVRVSNLFFGFVRSIFENNPGSLTQKIYWYHDGNFIHLPYEHENDRIKFFPPQEYLDELNRLAEN